MTGSGTVGDPYIISDVGDLQAIELDLAAYYELGEDIDASTTSGWNGGAGFVPISAFTGNLDGKGYAIDQLFINRNSWEQALISENTSGTIQYLHMTACDITGKSAGSLFSTNKGTYTRCTSTGVVNGRYAGGFGEDNQGSIAQSSTECIATASHAVASGWAGGFTNTNTGTIRNCHSRGALVNDAAGNCWLAGFVLYNNGGTVENCYSTGAIDVTAFGRYGFGDGDAATNCFWDTESSGCATSTIGTGKTTAQMKTESTFTDAGWDFTTIWAIIAGSYPLLLAFLMPTVTTDPATARSAIAATLNGTLDSDGGEACDCGFEWGLDTGYGTITPTESKTTGETFSQVIGGLFPGTTYHFRTFATNSVGTSYGADRSFATALIISKAYSLARREL